MQTSFDAFSADQQLAVVQWWRSNTVANDSNDDAKWSPAEWVEESMNYSIKPVYNKISDLMAGRDDEAWEALIDYQYEFYCSLCAQLNAAMGSEASIFKNWPLTEDFVIGIFEENEDEEEYEQLLKASIGEDKAVKLGII